MKRKSKSSMFRFVSSDKRGSYSVWCGGDHGEHIGYIEKRTHRIATRGVTRTIVAGWEPYVHQYDGSKLTQITLALEPTRETAARALFNWQRAKWAKE